MARWPRDTERCVIIGRTGSGKTQAAAHQLSMRCGGAIPWVILNFKEDDLLNEIPGVHLDSMKLPKQMEPTVYIAHPEPDDFETLENFLAEIWGRGNTGVFVDEAYMMARAPQAPNRWYRRLLIQGRSLCCPLISCTQQPAQIDSHVFTESEFFNIFKLQGRINAQTVEAKLDRSINLAALPQYHSYWYDHITGEMVALRPVPERGRILEAFERRLPKTPAQKQPTFFV